MKETIQARKISAKEKEEKKCFEERIKQVKYKEALKIPLKINSRTTLMINPDDDPETVKRRFVNKLSMA